MVSGKKISELFGYEPSSRSLSEGARYGGGLSSDTIEELKDEILSLLPIFGQDEKSLVREIGEMIRFRLIFALLPSECLYGSPKESKPIIRRHLEVLGVEPHEDLIRAIKFFCDNFRTKRSQYPGKWGVTDVFIRAPEIYNRIWSAQNGRCAVCGEVLHYGENMHLDHILPFHLGDDPPDGSNWQFLCMDCNKGKGVEPFYSIGRVTVNWIAPDSEDRLMPAVRFAVLSRDRACTKSGTKPSEAKLTVVKCKSSGAWILDNCATVRADLAELSPFK